MNQDEEKGLLTPVKNISNGYREYSIDDIDTVLLIEFYRSLDLSIDSIGEICHDRDLEDIKLLIDRKKQAVDEELRKLTRISENLSGFLSGYENVKKNLNKVMICNMDDFQIYNELTDFRSYDEYDKVHASLNKNPDKPIVRKFTRKIIFENSRIVESKMMITGPIDPEKTAMSDICKPGTCLYTVREDSKKDGSLMADIQRDIFSFIKEHDQEITGIAYANILFMARDEGYMKSYLEIFLPLKK